MKIEKIILANLIKNEQYMRKSLPFLKTEYLSESAEKVLFEEIQKYINKYNNLPTKASLNLSLKENRSLNENLYKNCVELIDDIDKEPSQERLQWLLDETEKFCQEKAIYNAIMQSIVILDGKDENRGKGSIPALLSDALSVSFDPNIGHSYLEDAEKRFEYYHRLEKRIPFDLEYFNKITRGGLPQKSLTIALAGTGVGKSLFMCHVAASCLMQNYNVLYITLEMSEEKIAERIDANLLNITIDDLMNLPREMYDKKMSKLKERSKGKLIIKEYPTASAHSGHFRALLNELNLKKNFKPDIIFIDYLNICASSRIKAGANVNSYTYIKAIAEEIRGLSIEFNVPIVSATQVNRSGYTDSDPGLENTSESFGLPATADIMFALISSEELENLNQIMVKQLKNRYNDINSPKRFTIGIDRAKMKLYDLENKAQDGIVVEPANTKPKPFEKKNKFNALKV